MLRAIEIVNAARRHLRDREDRHAGEADTDGLVLFEQLVLLDALGPCEQRDSVVEQKRALEQIAIKLWAWAEHLAAPRERGAPDIVVEHPGRVDRRGSEP